MGSVFGLDLESHEKVGAQVTAASPPANVAVSVARNRWSVTVGEIIRLGFQTRGFQVRRVDVGGFRTAYMLVIGLDGPVI